jgi:hypothetical protein
MEEKKCAGGGGQTKPDMSMATGESMSQQSTYFDTKNGVFQLQSIAGEDFRLLPKGMSALCNGKEAHAVYREKLVETVLKALRHTLNDHNNPGVYVQGPEGAGKSVLIYTVAQIAKFHLNWITVYVPNCKQWAGLDDFSAMRFFLDRVVDAFSVEHMQKGNSPFFFSSCETRRKRVNFVMQKMAGLMQLPLIPIKKKLLPCTTKHSNS